MENEALRQMILDIIGEVDYDISKQYDKETAEEPEFVDDALERLMEIARKHLKESGVIAL